jgi:hypothetical protein
MQISFDKHSKDSILDGNKDNINIHFPGPQILGWAACKCPLHCPGPSLLKAASRLSPQVPGQIRRGVGAQGGGVRSLLHMGQAGYISTTHWSLLHSTLSIIVHFNGSNGITYTRPPPSDTILFYIVGSRHPFSSPDKTHLPCKVLILDFQPMRSILLYFTLCWVQASFLFFLI